MSFNIGDVVVLSTRKGAVQYTVDNVQSEQYGQVLVKSNNTGKTQLVETDRLTLVEAAPSIDITMGAPEPIYADVDNKDPESLVNTPEPLTDVEIMAPWEIELLHGGTNPVRPFLLTVDDVTSDHKSYGAACDALIIATRQGIQQYAVIDHQGQRKVTRTAA